MIEGVVIKKVNKHTDERGFFAELVKSGEVAHGYKSIGRKCLGIVYHASQTYNPKTTVIKEMPFDDPAIDFDWTKS